ncbi:E3 ubiquitin-protein ligase UBR3-like isoform X2 [Anneissia japonica]|uniref:E3 ubiquitin-protein ligase UBR3-like isoform X2 n=1 Tax=Anneissia japonica TaxID=1529436 RepID=UPI001425B34A|nr:E3 ubiquitin-protein ligase UBR3-like isoform X2 [Anneissia japonica]
MMEVVDEVDGLIKIGPKSASNHINKNLKTSPQWAQRQVMLLLHRLLDKTDDNNTICWCRSLLSAGNSFDDFRREVLEYDDASSCGLVWTANFVAYRCRTCGVTPCMSVCSDCFHNSDHKGHDFNMFRSHAGGACDCGDSHAMRSTGFCTKHGPGKRQVQKPPPHLLGLAELVVPRLIYHLVLRLRKLYQKEKTGTYKLTQAMELKIEQIVNLLDDLSKMGGAMKTVLCQSLCSPELYKTLTEDELILLPDDDKKTYKELSNEEYKTALCTLPTPSIPDVLQDCPGLSQSLVHKTFLQEVMFWMVKYEFPQKINTFLLSLLTNARYKELFTDAFVMHYSRICMALARSPEVIPDRVVHISVQILSNEVLASHVVTDLQFFHVMILSIQEMIRGSLTDSKIKDERGTNINFHQVVSCSNPVIRNHCYWPIISDITNLMSHKSCVEVFFRSPDLIRMWTSLLLTLTGMNLNERERDEHLEFEPHYNAAFIAEVEACAAPMWQLVSHCQTEEGVEFSKVMIAVCMEEIQDLFDALNLNSALSSMQFSFHLPLLRHLAIFTSCAVNKQLHQLDPLLPKTNGYALQLMIFPLQIQVCLYEIFAGMWVRNGLQIRAQAMTYNQCHFCSSMLDLDIFMLQLCACKLSSDLVVSSILERYHVLDFLSLNPKHSNSFLDKDGQEMVMLEGALYLILSLISTRIHLGISNYDLLRGEIVSMLCMRDKTHSQLLDQIPERAEVMNISEMFEDILNEVADFKDPTHVSDGNFRQGQYVLKPELWTSDFDPIMVQMRSMQRKDYQASLDNYTAAMKQTGRHTGGDVLWPPYQPLKEINPEFNAVRQLLHSRTLHAALFLILYKAVSGTEISEPVLYQTVALISLALQCEPNSDTHMEVAECCNDMELSDWFPYNNMLKNLPYVIRTVKLQEKMEKKSNNPFRTLLQDIHPANPEEFHEDEVDILDNDNIAPENNDFNVEMEEHDDIDDDDDEDEEEEFFDAIQTAMDLIQMTGVIEIPPFAMMTSEEKKPPVPTDPPSENMENIPIELNESILTLLLKLYLKLSNEKVYLPSSVSQEVRAGHTIPVPMFGSGPYYIAKVLDRIAELSRDCTDIIMNVYEEHHPKKRQEETDIDAVSERKRKAIERQKHLLARFASQQKQFLEENPQIGVDDSRKDGSVAMETESFNSSVTMQEIECVICTQTIPASDENPLGAVVLIQPTKVLGHRYVTEDGTDSQAMQSSEIIVKPTRTCSVINEERRNILCKQFSNHRSQDSSAFEVALGYSPSDVHVQTCGHFLHLQCYSNYVTSLRIGRHNLRAGEYLCPLCRQLANSFLPCLRQHLQDNPDGSPVDRRDLNDQSIREEIEEGLRKDFTVVNRPDSVEKFVEQILRAKAFEFNGVISLIKMARTNLELDLINRNGSLLGMQPCPVPKRTCIGMLVHCIRVYHQSTLWDEVQQLWAQLLKGTPDGSGTPPSLLRNPINLLLQLIVSIRLPLSVDRFRYIVKVLWRLTYTQVLTALSCRLTQEEKQAWKEKPQKQGRLMDNNDKIWNTREDY